MKKPYLLLSLMTLGLISSCSKSDELLTPVLKDIYTAGYEFNGTNYVAKYWKNSVANNLTDGTNFAIARSIVVVGTDVYVAGYETNASNKNIAKYWKNGIATNIVTDASLSSVSNSIFVKYFF